MSVTPNDLALFRQWLKKQKYLPEESDDVIGIFFLLANGSLQRAKQLYDDYYKGAQTILLDPGDGDPLSEESEKLNKSMALFLSDSILPNGNNLIFFHLFDSDATHYRVANVIPKLGYMAYMILWNNLSKNGKLTVVINCENATVNHILHFGPNVLKHVVHAVLDCAPFQVEVMHFINIGIMFEWLINVLKAAFPSNYVHKLQFHSNMASLFDVIPRDMIPSDFGGTGVSIKIQNEKYREQLSKLRNRFKKEKLLREEELKFRPEIPEVCNHDSFRKLEID